MIKFNSLLANCAIFHTALDMTAMIRELIAERRRVDRDDLATMAPYITERIKRFGEYPSTGSPTRPKRSTRPSTCSWALSRPPERRLRFAIQERKRPAHPRRLLPLV